MDIVQYRREERIAYITLIRPEKLNAFSDEMSQALFNALYQFYDDEDAWLGIISGNGRAFCSGADVKQRQLRPPEELRRLGGPAGREGNIRHPFFRPPVGKPIIAAMHGYVYGAGLRIALYCDLTVATTRRAPVPALRRIPAIRIAAAPAALDALATPDGSIVLRLAADEGAAVVCLMELTLSPYFAFDPRGPGATVLGVPAEPEPLPGGPPANAGEAYTRVPWDGVVAVASLQ